MSLEDPRMLESKVTSKQQMESEIAKVRSCTYDNGIANGDNHAAEENKLGKAISKLTGSSQEATLEASDRGTQFQLLENVEDLKVSEPVSNYCQSRANLKLAEASEADTPNQPSDPGPSGWLIDASTAATFRKNNAGNVRENGEGANCGLTDNGFEQTDQRTESSDENINHGQKIDSKGLDESHALSQPLDVCPDIVVKSNTRFSHDGAEVGISPPANKVYPRNNVLDCHFEALGPHTITGACEGKFVDFSRHQLPSEESGIAIVVSTNLDGWQRFDAEENEVNGAFGCEQTIDGGSQQRLELWEQLLEDGLEGREKHFPISTSQAEAEVGIDSSLRDGNQFWLASPGNPFIEGLDRLSNFSEADGFAINENIARSQLLHSFEKDTSLPSQEGPSQEELFHNDHGSKDFSPGVICNGDKFVEANLSSQLNITCNHGSKQRVQPRFPSFSDLRRSTSKSREPSSMSFMEQVPPFQASNCVHGFESDGEKWEANFDLMVPATHEGPRSLSLPREAGDLQGQGKEQSLFLYSKEAPVTSQSKPSGFLSPKLSPMMKKVVNKVRTTPDQVLNTVRRGKSPKTLDKKEPKKWMWGCCVCCSHAH